MAIIQNGETIVIKGNTTIQAFIDKKGYNVKVVQIPHQTIKVRWQSHPQPPFDVREYTSDFIEENGFTYVSIIPETGWVAGDILIDGSIMGMNNFPIDKPMIISASPAKEEIEVDLKESFNGKVEAMYKGKRYTAPTIFTVGKGDTISLISTETKSNYKFDTYDITEEV